MYTKFIFVVVFIILSVNNCNNQPLSKYNSNALETSLRKLIEDDEYLNIITMADDDSFQDLFSFHNDGDQSILTREMYEFPIKWKRVIEDISSSILIESHEPYSDTIYASIDKTILGYLRIINLDTVIIDSSVQFVSVDTSEKPFTMDSQRRVRFVKLHDNNDQYMGWRISGRTPLILSSTTSTVRFTEIAFHDGLDEGSNSIFSLPIDDELLNTFYRLNDFPVFYPGELYKATATIINSNPDEELYPDSGEGVFMHKKFRHHRILRKPLFDDGLPDHSGDDIENDNVFTKYFQVRETGIEDVIKRNITFEVIDYETLLNNDGNYQSFIIGFPYIISP